MRDNTWTLWLILIVGGTFANDVWRFAGVWLSRGVNAESPVMEWARHVSTALVAGLAARLILYPAGALADVSPAIRFVAFGTAIAVFLVSGRNLLLALAAGEFLFLLAASAALP